MWYPLQTMTLAGGIALLNNVVPVSATAVPKWEVLSNAADIQPAYDYVIIGGGTAGLTVADRLTENSKVTVLVIEHGEIGERCSAHLGCYWHST